MKGDDFSLQEAIQHILQSIRLVSTGGLQDAVDDVDLFQHFISFH